MPTMQPRYYEDRYPIGRFITCHANDLGLTRRKLVERLGFRDRLAKGHRVLSEIMLTGTVPRYLTTIADALEVDQSLLDEVLYATARQQEAEWQRELLAREEAYRDRFRPHLQVRTERSIPSPIFVAALLTTERLRIVYLPDRINTVDEDERDRIVRDAIQQHYQETAGRVHAFGRIVGYYFIRFAGFAGSDFGVPYDRQGERAGEMVQVRRLPQAGLGIKRGDFRLTGRLENEPIHEILFDDIDLSDLNGPDT
jgi:hypothetical protein